MTARKVLIGILGFTAGYAIGQQRHQPDDSTASAPGDHKPSWWGSVKVIKVAGHAAAVYDRVTDTYVDDHGHNHPEDYLGSDVTVIGDARLGRTLSTPVGRCAHPLSDVLEPGRA